MNDALSLDQLIDTHLSHSPTVLHRDTIILFFFILTFLILFLHFRHGMVWYGIIWYIMIVNDNEFAAAVLRPSGRICDARWRGSSHP